MLSFMQEDAMGLSEPMDSFRFKCHGIDPLKTRKGFKTVRERQKDTSFPDIDAGKRTEISRCLSRLEY